MSTPTPNATGLVPSPASKKIGPASVSTPLNQYSSPAPRSIPSPAALRKDHAAKTPMNHPTGSSQGSKTIVAGGATPMIASLSQAGSTASPAGLLGLTPTGLGVDLGTPNAQLGTSMTISMSELGLTASGGVKRNEDEERRVKMRKILKSIGKVKGRVSEEGIARVSRRVGFANDIDAEKLTAEERDRRVGNRTISIAGNTTVIDVELKQHRPQSVQVVFPSELSGSDNQNERAGQMLLEDLQVDAQSPLSTTLDRFSEHLAQLAKIDHFSSSRLSCFDALSGIHRSLDRLHTQELNLVMSQHTSISEQAARQRVLNTRSGEPCMHENGRMGLAIRYWASSAQPWRENKEVASHGQQYSLDIGIGRGRSDLCPPIRISEAWLPETFELTTSGDGTAAIPWQDPPTTFLAADQDSMTDDASQALPNVHFVAKLEPAIVLPLQIAATILTSLGGGVTPPLLQPTTYTALVLGQAASQQSHFSATKDVLRPQLNANGKRFLEPVQHIYQLSTNKHDVGYMLEELRFSHPRQLIELLPTLRQWACTGSLIRQTMSDLQQLQSTSIQTATHGPLRNRNKTLDTLPIELSLAVNPAPVLSLAFRRNAKLCCPEVQVAENGKIAVSDSSIDNTKAAKVLEATQDLSIWVEWLLNRPTME